MYDIVKNVIQSGRFRLSEMTIKIDTLWAESKLTDDQRTELLGLMQSHLNPHTEAPELSELYKRLESKVEDLETRISALEESGTETETIPKWEPWDGVSDKYQHGAVVDHNEKYYVSTYEGQNTWEPGSAGVDERIWKEITKEEAEKLLAEGKVYE